MNHTERTGKILIGLFAASIVVAIAMIIVSAVRHSGSIDFMKSVGAGSHELTPPDSIAVLTIASAISFSSESSSILDRIEGGADFWIDQMKSVEDNPNIRAVIIRLDSPGGTVGATQEIYNQVKRLRAKGKIVVASMADMAASGAYYIAAGCDYIVANGGTLTGSIGVIMANIDLSELFKKYGVSYNVIKSGKNKDSLAYYRKLDDDERKLLEAVIMDTYEQFFTAVKEGRKMEDEELKKIADGRIFSGRQAQKLRLVDELGDFEDTIRITAGLAKISGEPNVIPLGEDRPMLMRLLSAAFPAIDRVLSAASPKLFRSGLSVSGGLSSPILYMCEY